MVQDAIMLAYSFGARHGSAGPGSICVSQAWATSRGRVSASACAELRLVVGNEQVLLFPQPKRPGAEPVLQLIALAVVSGNQDLEPDKHDSRGQAILSTFETVGVHFFLSRSACSEYSAYAND
jgi:hypothetical protein